MIVNVAARAANFSAECPDVGPLFPRENFVSFLTLFRQYGRVPMWGYLGESPTLAVLFERLGGFRGIREIDECVNVRVSGDKFYITEQRGIGDDAYEPFGFFKFMRDNEFRMRNLRAGQVDMGSVDWPGGYCYLELFPPQSRMHAAAVFGPSPLAGVLEPFIPKQTTLVRAPLSGYHYSPVCSDEALPVSQVPGSARVGGDFCANIVDGIKTDLPVCTACDTPGEGGLVDSQVKLGCQVRETLLPVEGLHESVRRLGSGWLESLPILLCTDSVTANGRPELPKLTPCMVGSDGHRHKYPDKDIGGLVTLHDCGPHPVVRLNFPNTLLLVPPGCGVYNDRIRFNPQGKTGGILVSVQPQTFYFEGLETHLVYKRLTQPSMTRFLHRRLAAGDGSRYSKLAGFHNAAQVLFLSDDPSVRGVVNTPVVEPGGSLVYSRVSLASYPVGQFGACITLKRGAMKIAGGNLIVKTRGKPPKHSVHAVMVCGGARKFSLSLIQIGKSMAQASVVVPDDPEMLDYASTEDECDVTKLTTMRTVAQVSPLLV